jgi:aspartate racemase
VLGKIEKKSKAEYLRIIAALQAEGAEGIILGCTEIGLLVQQADCRIPLFDTTLLHAKAAVDFALA